MARQANLSDVERALSIGLGLLLIGRAVTAPPRQHAIAVRRSPVGRVALGIGGAELVRRALSGWCPVVAALRPRAAPPRRRWEEGAPWGEPPSFTDRIDMASADSFPASDPPSWIPITRTAGPS